jgi:aspartokinase-like uncharacterized kinase
VRLPTGWRSGVLGRRSGSPAIPAGPLVVKCGGSLLSRRGWPHLLRGLSPALAEVGEPLWVVGGGAIVEGLRAIDAAGQLDTTLVHQLAIDLMAATARVVAAELDVGIVGTADGGGVLDAAAYLAAAPAPALPVGWDVTSDTIAATVARATARPLLLLKSTPAPTADPAVAAAAGWVDAWFPRVAVGVEWIGWACPAES